MVTADCAVGCSSKPPCFEETGYVLFPMNVTSHLKRGRKFLLDQKYTNKGNTLRPEGNLPFYE